MSTKLANNTRVYNEGGAQPLVVSVLLIAFALAIGAAINGSPQDHQAQWAKYADCDASKADCEGEPP